jgi:hypothetical protein
VKDENFLLKEMQNAGVDSSRLEEIKAELVEYYNANVAPQYDDGPSADSGIDMSLIDDLLKDDLDSDSQPSAASSKTETAPAVPANDKFPVAASSGADAGAEPEDLVDYNDGNGPAIEDEAQLQSLREKYKLTGESAFEQEWTKNHESSEQVHWSKAKREIDMEIIAAQRCVRTIFLVYIFGFLTMIVSLKLQSGT